MVVREISLVTFPNIREIPWKPLKPPDILCFLVESQVFSEIQLPLHRPVLLRSLQSRHPWLEKFGSTAFSREIPKGIGKSVGNLESWTEMTELLLMLQLVLSWAFWRPDGHSILGWMCSQPSTRSPSAQLFANIMLQQPLRIFHWSFSAWKVFQSLSALHWKTCAFEGLTPKATEYVVFQLQTKASNLRQTSFSFTGKNDFQVLQSQKMYAIFSSDIGFWESMSFSIGQSLHQLHIMRIAMSHRLASHWHEFVCHIGRPIQMLAAFRWSKLSKSWEMSTYGD